MILELNQKLTFDELDHGEHFICWPIPGDNSGHGGYLGAQRVFVKTGKLTASDGRGVESSMSASMDMFVRITSKEDQ